MKIVFAISQKMPAILISAVIGLLFAMIIGVSALNFLDYGLKRQLFFFFLLSLGMSLFCYILLTRLPARSKTLGAVNDIRYSTLLRKIFLAVFFLFPIILIFSQQLPEFLQILSTGRSSDFIGWLPSDDHNRALFIQIFALSCIVLMGLFLAGKRPSVQSFFNNLSDFWYVLFILLFSLAIRIPIIYSINTQPISDFGIINEDALALAQGDRPTHMYVATHVAVTIVYGFVYDVFGSDLSLLKIFHAVAYALAGIFLYGAGKMIFDSKLWAWITALLLVGLPSLAVYSNVLTPEHLFILVECALIFVVASLFRNHQTTEQKTGDALTKPFIARSILIGLLIGLMGMFRPFSELFLVAFVFTLFLYIRSFKAIAVSTLCVLVAFWLLRDIPALIATHYQNQFGNIRPCNLLVGLNFEAAGQYNAEDVELCSKLRTEISDETVLTRTIMDIIWERFQKQQNDLLLFIDEKFAILWTNSNGILFWTVRQVNGGDQNSILETVRKIDLIDFAIMLLLTITCVIGTILAFFKDLKPAVFFCLLAFFGFNLMEIPFELQTRYRTVVMPLLIVFACWSLAVLSASMNTHNYDPLMRQDLQG
jgi:hypothetical protein